MEARLKIRLSCPEGPHLCHRMLREGRLVDIGKNQGKLCLPGLPLKAVGEMAMLHQHQDCSVPTCVVHKTLGSAPAPSRLPHTPRHHPR